MVFIWSISLIKWGFFFLNVALVELLALLNKFPYFDNSIELYVLVVGILFLGIHDLIHCNLFNLIRINLCEGKFLENLNDILQS